MIVLLLWSVTVMHEETVQGQQKVDRIVTK